MPELSPAWQQEREHATLVCWVCALSAVAAGANWYADSVQGLNTPWDDIGAPGLTVIYMLAVMLLRWRPQWLDAIVLTALVPTSLYYLGSLVLASRHSHPNDLYSVALNAQFMPLFYVGAFVALRRHAALVSWLHYAAMAGLYIHLYGLPFGASQTASRDPVAHIWSTLLASHLGYIVALYYIAALRDRLRAAELASHRGKERFLAMLSHEIRTPLQSMLGSIDLLALKAQGPAERRAVDRIRHAAAQLDTHLRDVSEYTRLENPSWRLQTESVDLGELLRKLCQTFQPQAQDKGLELVCELPAAHMLDLGHVSTDPARVRQVLGNLVSNALKYTPSGQVTVRARPGAVAGSVVLEVIDTGVGIATPDLQRIFEPYVRLEDQRTAGAEGSGLGLAVVSRLVERLGGEMKVHSRPGLGSCFSLTLPLQT